LRACLIYEANQVDSEFRVPADLLRQHLGDAAGSDDHAPSEGRLRTTRVRATARNVGHQQRHREREYDHVAPTGQMRD
jgi:hypothetical protein